MGCTGDEGGMQGQTVRGEGPGVQHPIRGVPQRRVSLPAKAGTKGTGTRV